MTEGQKKILEDILKECFWGDYRISLQDAEKKLTENDDAFEKFLAGRIISGCSFPSARLRSLFPKEKLRNLLDSIVLTGRADKRRSLARAVLFNEPWEWEPSWKR
ncbi:MAG: hypothetical protein JW874_04485 [Spirochaetales bacterium]|nr:hypothetical protein [Spirochaetales bacterium]